MAMILQNGNGDGKTYAIIGLKTNEFFTLFDIIENERVKAGDPSNKTYTDEEAKKVLALCNMLQEKFRDKVKL